MSRFRVGNCSLLAVVLVALSGGFVTCVAGAWTITEFSTTSGAGPNRITVGGDGALWFTEWFGNIGRITTDGVITEFSLPLNPKGFANWGASGIAAGPDDNLWFTNSLSNKIGRITTSGEITEFDIPWTPVSCGFLCVKGDPRPASIVAGPDNNLWFTEGNGKVGRITTSGVITEFPISAPVGATQGDIVVGPDGALWFADWAMIGRITTDGALTEFVVPPINTGDKVVLENLIAGPDGTIWFTGGGIRRITVTGVVTEVFESPLRAPCSPDTCLAAPISPFPGAIVTGPDGNLWFTGFKKIGRITTAGLFTEFPIPGTTAGDLRSIAAGPDGALWFTESDSGKIGRITTSVATPAPLPTPIGRHARPVPYR